MEGHGRMQEAFRSGGWNNGLKQHTLIPQDRFSDLDRAQLADRLERLAEVRSAVVARGQALIANPHYPDTAIVRRVSDLLARHVIAATE